jgi:hypothetical protein
VQSKNEFWKESKGNLAEQLSAQLARLNILMRIKRDLAGINANKG